MDSHTLHLRMTDDLEEVLKRMEALVRETSEERGGTTPIDDADPVAREHRKAVRDGVE